ncbi:contact-dependent growth inhibition system immunity protein [Nocardia sp. NPDC057030]|uniref:contact-dependent growth inhibition system immunity protein n=1 Tax=unclassified Nocardia TaxID=2637762 RepID=UPI00362B279D
MESSVDDESLILELIKQFRASVERGIPREMAALMCAAEAEQFVDSLSDPDFDLPIVEPIGALALGVSDVHVFGDIAFAQLTHSPHNVTTLFFRHEAGRWTVCADAGEDLSLEQLKDDAWPAMPADATDLMRRVHELRRKPIGGLTEEGVRCLLQQNEGVDVLLSRALQQLRGNPLAEGDLYPGDLLVAVLGVGREHWWPDPVAATRIGIVIDKVRDLGDLTEHGAPHEEIWKRITDFLADQPSNNQQPHRPTDVGRVAFRPGLT